MVGHYHYNFDSLEYYTTTSIKDYLDVFLKGMHKVIPEQYFSIFYPEELEMIMFGIPIVSIEDWKSNTHYKGEYYKTNERIQWFWEIVEDMTQQQQAQFLQFCTGSSRVPIEGFK